MTPTTPLPSHTPAVARPPPDGPHRPRRAWRRSPPRTLLSCRAPGDPAARRAAPAPDWLPAPLEPHRSPVRAQRPIRPVSPLAATSVHPPRAVGPQSPNPSQARTEVTSRRDGPPQAGPAELRPPAGVGRARGRLPGLAAGVAGSSGTRGAEASLERGNPARSGSSSRLLPPLSAFGFSNTCLAFPSAFPPPHPLAKSQGFFWGGGGRQDPGHPSSPPPKARLDVRKQEDLKEKKEKVEEKAGRKERKKEVVEEEENGAEEEEEETAEDGEEEDEGDEEDEEEEEDEDEGPALKRAAEEEDEADPKRQKTENGASA
nr:parathymosin [Odocoileus virginianus texanus]